MITVSMDLTDILHRRQQGEALAELLDRLPHPVWVFDEHDHLIDRNLPAQGLEPPTGQALARALTTTAEHHHWHGSLETAGELVAAAWCTLRTDRHDLAPAKLLLVIEPLPAGDAAMPPRGDDAAPALPRGPLD